jgi:hypothetical protein
MGSLVRAIFSTVILLAALSGCRHQNPDETISDGGVPIDLFDPNADIAQMACVSQSQEVSTLGADILFVLDTSYSMDFNFKWIAVSQAMDLFVTDPRFTGLGVGIQYFPLRETCDVPSYATPTVPIAVLPGAGQALTMSIDGRRMSGGTPTVPAMEGVLQYATARAAAMPDRKQVILLATDGIPDDSCPIEAPDAGLPNSIDSVVQLVKAAATATPPVTTFVVGVGAELTALDAIAAAGGGAPKAFLVDTGQDLEFTFSQALDQIRKQAFDCEFPIPTPAPGLMIDYTKVNVSFVTMTMEPFVYVVNQAGCAKNPSDGWYYDDPNKPTKVVLCSETCDRIRMSSAGKVEVTFGCDTVVP